MKNEGQPMRLHGISIESPRINPALFSLMYITSELHSKLRNMQIEGEHLPKHGPALLAVGPHADMTDPLILNAAVMKDSRRMVRLISIADAVDPTVAKDPNRRQIDILGSVPMPILRMATASIVGMYDPIPVQRYTADRRFVRNLDTTIKQGHLIGLFVEDADEADDLKTTQPGAAHIALNYPDLPVYPVGIVNANRKTGFRNLKVRIGKSFTAAQLLTENPSLNKAALTQHIANSIADLIGIEPPVIK